VAGARGVHAQAEAGAGGEVGAAAAHGRVVGDQAGAAIAIAHQQAIARAQQGAAGQRLAAVAEHVHVAADQAGQRRIRALRQQQSLRDHLRVAVGKAQRQCLGIEEDRQVADHHVVGTGGEGQRALFAHHRIAVIDVAAAMAGVQGGTVAAIQGERGGVGGICRPCAGQGSEAGEGEGGAMCCRHEAHSIVGTGSPS
jgi:hypothetical protein